MKIRQKLALLCVGLVVVPVILTGVVSILFLQNMGRLVVRTVQAEAKNKALTDLALALRSDVEALEGAIEMGRMAVGRLANSRSLLDYLDAVVGDNKTLNSVAENDASHIVEGVVRQCAAIYKLQQANAVRNLSVANKLLNEKKGLVLTDAKIKWEAINQYTKEKKEIVLPGLAFGDGLPLPRFYGSQDHVPVVDETTLLVGGVCTIFQRMNERGDMLRVATTVLDDDGKRSLGKYVPAILPDGTTNPVVAALIKGDSFEGRALGADGYYVTACEPLKDRDGRVIGGLVVGFKELKDKASAQSIKDISISRMGSVFLMNSQGTILLDKDSANEGKDVVKDLGLPFSTVLKNRLASRVRILRYDGVGGQKKFLAYMWFKPWDWIICADVYYNDVVNALALKAKVKEEALELFLNSAILINGRRERLFEQLRYVDDDGQEVISVQDGVVLPDKDLTNKADENWFKMGMKLELGQVGYSRVEEAENTALPTFRIIIPVYRGDQIAGLAVGNFRLETLKCILQTKVHGKTGYTFLIDPNGYYILHPKYSLKDKICILDPKYGSLADVAKNMTRGKSGTDSYTFEGVDKFTAYGPMILGTNIYGVAAVAPVAEVTSSVAEINKPILAKITRVSFFLVGVLALCCLSGAVIGIYSGKRVSRPILKAVNLARAIKKGDTSLRVDALAKDEIGELAVALNVMADDIDKKVKVAEAIAAGDLDVSIELASDKDVLGKSFMTMISVLNNITAEISALVKEVVAGHLVSRGNVSQCYGAYRNMFEEINTLLARTVGYIDEAPLPAITTDKDLKIIYANKRFADLTGKNPDQIIGENSKKILCDAGASVSQLVIERELPVVQETTAKPKNETLDIKSYGAPIKDNDGQLVGTVMWVVDQTATKEAVRMAHKVAEYQDVEVNKLTDCLRRLAAGDLTIESLVGAGDEDVASVREKFIAIGSAINQVVANFKEILGAVKTVAAQIATGASEIANASQALSTGATEQASSLEQATTSMQSISSQAKTNAENARQADVLAQAARDDADDGSKQISDMVQAMSEINNASQQIANIINVIDDIAFQTNLLALNAAVEAARAGRHGKGFAVVAEEVRSLAGRSADAAKETAELIASSGGRVEKGLVVANKTADSFKKIFTSVVKATDLVGEIAAASHEQAQLVDQVNQGLIQVEQVTQRNATSSEEAADAAEELSGHSQQLREILGHFDIGVASDEENEADLSPEGGLNDREQRA